MHLIRVNLKVTDLHALAGVHTNGLSITAVYGLVMQVAKDTQIGFRAFALCVESYAARLNEFCRYVEPRSLAVKQTGYRMADAAVSLYFLLDTEPDEESLRGMARSLNKSRFQCGTITNFIDAADFTYFEAETAKGLLLKFYELEKRISHFYADVPAVPGLAEEDLLTHYAKELQENQKVLVRNGLVQVGAQHGLRVAEASFGLAELVPAYKLKNMDWPTAKGLMPRLFWKFDEQLNEKNPDLFIINSSNATE